MNVVCKVFEQGYEMLTLLFMEKTNGRMQPECSPWTERDLCLSVLCSKAVSVVFWVVPGFILVWMGVWWVGGYSPWNWMGLMGLGTIV